MGRKIFGELALYDRLNREFNAPFVEYSNAHIINIFDHCLANSNNPCVRYYYLYSSDIFSYLIISLIRFCVYLKDFILMLFFIYNFLSILINIILV